MWLNWASKHGTHMVEALAQQPKMNGRIKKNLARMCKKTLKSHCHTVGNSFESCCCRIQSYRWPHQKDVLLGRHSENIQGALGSG